MSQSAQPAGFGRGYTESRIATHDGYIWPIARERMQSPGAIRERMVEDIDRLVNDGGAEACVTQQCLIRKGWPSASVEAHAMGAFRIWKASHRTAGQRRRPGPVATLTEAAALFCFTSAALLWAGIGAGVL